MPTIQKSDKPTGSVILLRQLRPLHNIRLQTDGSNAIPKSPTISARQRTFSDGNCIKIQIFQSVSSLPLGEVPQSSPGYLLRDTRLQKRESLTHLNDWDTAIIQVTEPQKIRTWHSIGMNKLIQLLQMELNPLLLLVQSTTGILSIKL